jgi:ribosomal protein L16 Arg81 hydroxylase
MRRSTLEEVLSPISIKTFLWEYFGKRPLLIRGTPRKFNTLLKPQDFIRNLDRVTEIRCVFGELRQATIGPGDLREMFEAGATICVTGIDRAHPSLSRAARRIESEIGYAGCVDFRAYLSPPRKGFDIHYDARVATTLQLDGTKTWWYSREPHTLFPMDNSSRTDMPAIRRAVSKVRLHKVTLHPGDLLCIPPGVWHKARAGSYGSLALNLAFNHTNGSVLDVMLQQLRELLSHERACREPFFTGSRSVPARQLQANLESCIRDITRTIGPEGRQALIKRAMRSVRHRRGAGR